MNARRLAVALATLAAVFLAAVFSTGPATAAPTSSNDTSACTQYTAILAPGTWETTPTADPTKPVGLLAPVGQSLRDKYGPAVRVLYPAYSASAFDKGQSYTESKATLITAIQALMRGACSATSFLLGGYSQGADGMGDTIAAIGNNSGPVPASRVAGWGLIADPQRDAKSAPTIGPVAPGRGIAGARPGGFGSLAQKGRQMCGPGDLYCSVDSNRDDLLSGLGRVLGGNPGGQNLAVTHDTTTGTSSTGSTAPDSTSTSTTDPTSSSTDTSAPAGTGTSSTSATDTATPSPSTQGSSSIGVDSATAQGPAATLVTDFSRADLPGTVSTADTLVKRVQSLPSDPAGASGDLAGIAGGASSVTNTLTPLQDVASFAAKNPAAVQALKDAPADSPQHAASQILDATSKIDMPGALSTAKSLTDTASTLLSGPSTTAAPTRGSPSTSAPGTTATPSASSLHSAADTLSGQVAPLNGLSTDTLSAGTRILSTLKPDTVVRQVLNVVTGASSLAANMPKIGQDLLTLPQQVATLDIAHAHQTAGELNNLFAPAVKMLAGVDRQLIAQVLSAAASLDPSGYMQIASTIFGFLANVDVIGLANDIGQLQEIGWNAAEKLTKGDILGAGAAFTGALPVGLHLATIAAGVLGGGAQQTDPAQLGQPNQISGASSEISGNAASGNLGGLASNLMSLAGSQGAQDLAKIAAQAVDAGTFYASGAHQDYGWAVKALSDFFVKVIGA